MVFVFLARKYAEVKDRKAQNAIAKQENGQDLTVADRFATGERIPVTAAKVVTGKSNDHIPTSEERRDMTTMERVKDGETFRHMAVGAVKEKKAEREDRMDEREEEVFRKQEEGEDLTPGDRISAGEGVVRTAARAATGRMNDRIPTPEERDEMTRIERVVRGERVTHVLKDKKKKRSTPFVDAVAGKKPDEKTDGGKKANNSADEGFLNGVSWGL
uniref:Uncharacterized protein n=1 Tax=Pseudictyota dubia TaxID=2749911 RepID=A0A7R9VRT0_9STRA|mmetsp:Transcript_2193/g.3734  ORF Transcript_2193/g.3734 Transcript_2193/m.3734 type:complete len:216 (+) Transcript_2193:249-896(+)